MNTPRHQDVTQRAYYIWEEYGRPEGRETEIWLKAEQQLTAEFLDAHSDFENDGNRATSDAKGTSSMAARGKAEKAGDHALSSSVLSDSAVQSALQKKEARAPQHATKLAPHAAPAESGKPLWNQPHSS